MPWTDAFIPAEKKYRAEVLQATWGHLAPHKHRAYHGYMTFAIGCYDHGSCNPTPLAVEFDGLDNSPWLYEAVHERLQSWQNGHTKRPRAKERFAVGGVYRFDGFIRNYRFVGKIRRVV